MNERELWLKCVNHCIKNDIIGFHLMFDVFLEVREREGYKLVPVEKVMDCLYQISDRSYVDDNVSEIKAMIGLANDTRRN